MLAFERSGGVGFGNIDATIAAARGGAVAPRQRRGGAPLTPADDRCRLPFPLLLRRRPPPRPRPPLRHSPPQLRRPPRRRSRQSQQHPRHQRVVGQRRRRPVVFYVGLRHGHRRVGESEGVWSERGGEGWWEVERCTWGRIYRSEGGV